MGLSVSGLASGIDSDSIISQLLALEEQRIFVIQRRIAEEEVKKSAYDDLSNRVKALRSVGSSLKNSDVYGKLTASSSDAGITVSTTKTAAEGSYEIEVLQTATRHRIAAQGFVDDDSAPISAAGGTFSFRLGAEGTLRTIDVDAAMTLKQLAEKINEAGSANASIVNDGSDLNSYRLVLTSRADGKDNEIVIEQNDTLLNFADKQIEAVTSDSNNSADYLGTVSSGGTYTGEENTSYVLEIMTEGAADGTAKYRLSTDGGLTFSDNNGVGFAVTSGGPLDLGNGVLVNFEDNGTLREGDTFSIDVFNPLLESGKDALLKVDGINIRKSSNRISDVFDGITFNIESATVGQSAELKVERDSGSVTEKLAEFIGAYNGVVGFLSAQFKFDPASNTAAPPLNGDSAARQVDRDVKRLIATRMQGVDSKSVSTLTELGLTSDKDTGLLSFDPSKLDEITKDDPKAVERVLSSFGERLSGNFEFVSRSSKTKPGTYDVVVTQARTRAQLTANTAADVLAQEEVLSFNFSRSAQSANGAVQALEVTLEAGKTVEQQVNTLNEKFAERNFELEAYLDDDSKINLRATEYGDDYSIDVTSSLAAGAGTTGIGNVQISAVGTDLEGRIGAVSAEVFQGNQLRGADGYSVDGIRVDIPDDVSGQLGKVRIVDGLAQILPGIVDSLTGSNGVIGTRTSGVNKRIESLETDIVNQQERMTRTEGRLRRQFTAMEVTMAQLNSLGDYITQQMEAMNASKKK